jgi:hypothetical protein
MPPRKEKFLTVQSAGGTRVAIALDKVEQASYEVVRGVLNKHLVLRLPSSNVAIHREEEERILGALGIKDLKGEEEKRELKQGGTHE